jgi:hypothetical protein
MSEKKRVNIICSTPARNMPVWAYLERTLIDTMNDAIDIVLQKYLRPNGEFLWPPQSPEECRGVGSLDDVYESFHSWPIFYLLGGADRFLELSHRQYDVTTAQFARYSSGSGCKAVEKDFTSRMDWMHQGEGYEFFYNLNLADPENPKTRERAIRYAGFYLNEDPTIEEPNFDPEHQVMRSSSTGSMGAGFGGFSGVWGYAKFMDFYGIPFYDLPGICTVFDLKDPQNARRMGEAVKARQQHSDTIINLLSTTMVMNAYLHTGEEKYRKWILDYTEAWRKRTEENNGILPDNAGPSGKVGELMNGKWWGGYYGWTWPHGFCFMADAITTAAEHECLLTGDAKKLNWVREQTSNLMKHGVDIDGTLFIPQKYAEDGSVIEYSICNDNVMTRPDKVTDREDFSRKRQIDGWFEFSPLLPTTMTHSYFATMEEEDLVILRKTRDYRTNGHKQIDPTCMEVMGGDKLGYQYYPSAMKYLGGQDRGLIGYHDGTFPNYPEEILKHNLSQVYRRLKEMQEDDQDPSTYTDDYLQLRNPITVEGLIHLTLGGPMPIYNGGLLMVNVRYFDVDSRRPGLPKNVAALVSKITNEGIVLTLCNLHPTETRRLSVQAGAFGEHRFTTATAVDYSGNRSSYPVQSNVFEVTLGPGSILELELGMERFVNQPSYHTDALEG